MLESPSLVIQLKCNHSFAISLHVEPRQRYFGCLIYYLAFIFPLPAALHLIFLEHACCSSLLFEQEVSEAGRDGFAALWAARTKSNFCRNFCFCSEHSRGAMVKEGPAFSTGRAQSSIFSQGSGGEICEPLMHIHPISQLLIVNM